MTNIQQNYDLFKAYASLCVSTAITTICAIVGIDTYAFRLLILLITIDYVTGIIVGLRKKSRKTKHGALSSKVASKGAFGKFMVLVNIAVAVRIEPVLNFEYTAEMVVAWYIVREVISISENTELLGAPMPNKWRKVLDVFYDKEDKT